MTDISNGIKNGTRIIDGLAWNSSENEYYLHNNVTWTDSTTNEYILLQDGETFDGRWYTITIGGTGITNGIFASNGSTLNEGPIIKKVGSIIRRRDYAFESKIVYNKKLFHEWYNR